MATHSLLVVVALASVLTTAPAQDGVIAPSGRSGFSMAWDAARERLVVFGGTSGERQADTWEWDGVSWRRFDGPGPVARLDAAMTYDAARGVTVLFGGSGKEKVLGDTWTWDGKAWKKLAVAGPPARKLSCMTYDAGRRRCVLFGGQGKKRLKDTWEWDGKAWHEMARGLRAPAARGAHEIVYDGKRKKTVLHGGYSMMTHEDAWAWDGKTWERLPDGVGGPRLHFAMGYDETRERVVVYGGFDESKRVQDTWEWHDIIWTRHAGTRPEARAEHDGTWCGQFGFVVFGGVVGQGMAPGARKRVNGLWSWDGKAWKKLAGVE